jgi:hypothetical protein
LNNGELTMRKALILTTALVGIGGLVVAAQASQDRAPEKNGTPVTSQTESLGKDGKDLDAPRDERSREAREQYREERRKAHEEEEETRD